MARIRASTPPKPIKNSKFLGVNESVGETEIKQGEAVLCENFKITKNYTAKKGPGHHTYINCTSGQIRGMWYGVLNGVKTLLFAHGGNLYRRNTDVPSAEVNLSGLLVSAWDDSLLWDDSEIWDESANPPVILIGAIPDEHVEFTWFKSKVYIKGATTFKTYNGTTYADIVPYVPTVATGTPPAGGGTLFQEVNLLTGLKKQEFVGNGTATVFQLAETSIDASPSATATVNGVTTSVTVNVSLGTVTFSVAPVNNSKVIVTWSKASATNLALIMGHKYMTDYGVENDTNLFLFGNDAEKHTFRFSMVGEPTYFPATSFTRVDSDQFYITDIIAQYGSLLIYKERSTQIVVPKPNPNYETNKGLNPYNFPYRDLNESVGNIAPKAVQLVGNNPVSLYGSSIRLWSSETGVESEINEEIISDRLKLSLQKVDLSTAVTYDFQDEKELWVAVGGKAYIWNYGNDTMYTRTNVNAQQMLNVDGDLVYIDGFKMERFKEEYVADGALLGDNIHAIMKLGFTDLGAPSARKVMRDAWIPISPDTRSSVTVKFATNRKLESEVKSYYIESRLLDFDDVDFDDFTFNGNTNPQPGYIKAKVKDFVLIQPIFENDSNDETLNILGYNMAAQITGNYRG